MSEERKYTTAEHLAGFIGMLGFIIFGFAFIRAIDNPLAWMFVGYQMVKAANRAFTPKP